MKEFVVPIDSAGRLVLPKDIRNDLAIKPGDTFKVSINGGAVTLNPNSERTGLVRKGKALVFSAIGSEVLSNDTVVDIIDAGRYEREASIVESLGGRKRTA